MLEAIAHHQFVDLQRITRNSGQKCVGKTQAALVRLFLSTRRTVSRPANAHRFTLDGEERLALALFSKRLPTLGCGVSANAAFGSKQCCLEAMVHDLRLALRVLHERKPAPTAVIYDSRVLSATPGC